MKLPYAITFCCMLVGLVGCEDKPKAIEIKRTPIKELEADLSRANKEAEDRSAQTKQELEKAKATNQQDDSKMKPLDYDKIFKR